MRVLRALAALLALLAGVAGVPAALVALVGNPLPSRLSWGSVLQSLIRPDDGSVLIGVVTVICWLAWFAFASSVLIELANLLSGYRLRLTLPGLARPQRLAAGLLLAVLAVGSLPGLAAHAAPVPAPASTSPTPTSSASRSDSTPPSSVPSVRLDGESGAASGPVARRQDASAPASQQLLSAAPGGSPTRWHEVQRGDDLWSLSEQYYGDGREWRRIASANPDLLSGGPDRLLTGWRLRIPETASKDDSGPTSTTVVRKGDTLSSIADRALGESSRWKEVFDANRALLADPDEIQAGMLLKLPASAVGETRSGAGTGAEVDPKAREAANPAEPTAPERAPGRPEIDAPAPTSRPPSDAPPRERLPAPSPTGAHPSVAHAQPTGADQPEQSAEDAAQSDPAQVALGVASVGGLLAAAVLGGLALRRRAQLQARPLGRRIAHPGASAQQVETALGHRQQPLSLATLDLALRAVAAHCRQEARALPPLTMARVGQEAIELVLSEPVDDAPVGFQVSGTSWVLSAADAGYLHSAPGVDLAARPFPALVSLGADHEGQQVLVDLEAIGLLAVDADPDLDSETLVGAVLTAMAVELSFSPWAEEMTLTLVGSASSLPDALGQHNVARCDDLDALLDRLERRAAQQRVHQSQAVGPRQRWDPDLAEAWAPEIVLIGRPPGPDQSRRLVSLVTAEPRVTLAVVSAGPVAEAPWSLHVMQTADSPAERGAPHVAALLLPSNLRIVPQLVPTSAEASLVELVAATGTVDTAPAPWWDHGDDPPSVLPAGNVTYLGKRFGGWGQGTPDAATPTEGEGAEDVAQPTDGTLPKGGPSARTSLADRQHPVLRLLGPVELTGTHGTPPPRAGRQCLEYCCWLLEHPGTTAQAMASALVVAEGTRRSNMSRLRTWLGADSEGKPYLPDAYTGRIVLHPCVSSDWQRLQILTAAGVNTTSTSGLRAALDLVRGAPLADAAPGQWHWAEELRTDMISVVRDIGVELASRALAEHDVDLARWAAARALAAAPGDELLIATRIRTEHLAGNVAETERLTLQLAGQARALGVDLDSATVVLLQEVMEGRVRARLA